MSQKTDALGTQRGGSKQQTADPGQLFSGSKHDPGGKFGGAAPNAAADQLAAISKQTFDEATPLRRGLLDRSQSFIDGNQDVTGSPQYAALKAGSDSQFNRARNNTIASTASGGALTDALANLETGRAVNMTQGMGGIADNEMARTFALATGGTPASISGLSSAASIQQQQLAAQQAQQQAGAANAGSALGSIAAIALK